MVKIETKMSNISPQVRKTLEQLVKGDVGDFEVTVHKPNKKGEGFLGEMLFLTLQDKKSRKKFDFVVKQAFSQQFIRDNFPIRDVFINEINFYTRIWPRMDEFQKRIPTAYHFQKIPKCLAAVSEDDCEHIVFENLKLQEFVTHDKKIPLDKEHFELILKEYGKFHGISFAFQALHPEAYADMVKVCSNLYSDVCMKEFFQKQLKYTYEISADSLQPGVDDAVLEKFQPYIENYLNIFRESAESQTKYTVVTHGDCWSNNMMFKYNDSKRLIDVRFFDFQIVREASPCCDLSYCIYSGASKEILKELNYYLQVYHDSLSETLRQFGCDPEKLYPLHQLKSDWKKYCPMGFSMAFLVWKIKFSYEDDLKDFTDLGTDEQDNILKSDYDMAEFRKHIRDLLYHLYENDFL